MISKARPTEVTVNKDAKPGAVVKARVDDFFVIETPSCLSVTGVGSALTSSTSADVFWTSVSASFQVQYDTSGFTPGTGSFMVVTSDTLSP